MLIETKRYTLFVVSSENVIVIIMYVCTVIVYVVLYFHHYCYCYWMLYIIYCCCFVWALHAAARVLYFIVCSCICSNKIVVYDVVGAVYINASAMSKGASFTLCEWSALRFDRNYVVIALVIIYVYDSNTFVHQVSISFSIVTTLMHVLLTRAKPCWIWWPD